MKKALAALAIAAILLAGCGSATREIKINASEYKYDPNVIQVKAGEKVKFTVTNVGSEEHEFESEDAKIDELVIPPGKTRSVVVTMPTKPGEYEIFCDAPGHKANGMTAKIVVSK